VARTLGAREYLGFESRIEASQFVVLLLRERGQPSGFPAKPPLLECLGDCQQQAQALSAPNQRHVVAKRIGAATIVWIGISGMHYTGLAAAHFLPGAICGAANGISEQWLATTIAIFTLVILTVTLMVSRFGTRTTFLRGMADTLEKLVKERTDELEGALRKNKLASIGQLSAGVAHEINNPIGFVTDNLNTLRTWVQQLLDILSTHEALVEKLNPEIRAHLVTAWRDADIDYVRQDILVLIDESIDGAMCVRRIVQDLYDFSRPGGEDWNIADLHIGLESTLNVIHKEIKYKAQVVRKYGELPHVECLSPQLNQVFMNLLLNAAQAIPEQGIITIQTTSSNDMVSIAISDTGVGMAADVVNKVFDPFFTTKPVGQVTGLGLTVSHSILERHHGQYENGRRQGAQRQGSHGQSAFRSDVFALPVRSGLQFFMELIAALGSTDGREIALELDALSQEGFLFRLRDGEWALESSADKK
jgi:two-component system, NtrC family, sensor kinase